ETEGRVRDGLGGQAGTGGEGGGEPAPGGAGEAAGRETAGRATRARKGRRVVRIYKDMRVFRNGILQVVREMERGGLAVDVEEQVSSGDDGDVWEIRLTVRRAKERR
ncbi:MAG: hypothetical protein DIU82_06095, partial [Bacillota bacterium]